MKMKLSEEKFLEVIKNTPLIAIDLIIENENKEILLGLRKNEPAKNSWFVPGGRILKNETIKDTIKRLIQEEIGLISWSGSYKILGVYQHFYETCFYEKNPYETSTHYIVIPIQINIEREKININQMKEQHTDVKWKTCVNIVMDEDVHLNTKQYFMNQPYPHIHF